MIALKPMSIFGCYCYACVDWGEPGNCRFFYVSEGIGRIVSDVLLSMLAILGLCYFYRKLSRLTSRSND